MGNKFFDATEDLVTASMQALRVLRKRQDVESRMVYENLLMALRQMGIKNALKHWENHHVA